VQQFRRTSYSVTTREHRKYKQHVHKRARRACTAKALESTGSAWDQSAVNSVVARPGIKCGPYVRRTANLRGRDHALAQTRHSHYSRPAMPTDPAQFLVLGVIWYIVFLFSTTCHEGAHALVAKIGGDPTAFHGGQVSLNPWPHIRREPFGTVVVPIISYIAAHWMIGWASAPYDPNWQQRYPRRAAWMALAGPAANFTLMLLAAIAIKLGVHFGAFRPPSSANFTHVTEATSAGAAAFAATFLSILFVLNLLLGTFNLLPVPPLDGRNVITIFMNDATALRFLSWTNQGFGLIGLIAAWYLFDKIFTPLFTLALNLLYPGASYG
jgi:Zn-dependent protease